MLALGRAAHSEGAVVAGPVAVEGVDDVEEGLVAGPDDAVGEVVRMRVAPFARDGVAASTWSLPSSYSRLLASATISFSRMPGLSTSTMSW